MMNNKSLLWLVGIGAVGYLLYKRTKLGSILSGLGCCGTPRLGRPKIESERAATHEKLFGKGPLPPRGSGLLRRG